MQKLLERLIGWLIKFRDSPAPARVSEIHARLDRALEDPVVGVEPPVVGGIAEEEQMGTEEAMLRLMRHLLGSVHVDEEALDKMPSEERAAMLASAHRVVNEISFPFVVNLLKTRQLEFSMLQADFWEKVLFGRGTFNGVGLFEEQFALFDAQYVESTKAKEQFDKQEII